MTYHLQCLLCFFKFSAEMVDARSWSCGVCPSCGADTHEFGDLADDDDGLAPVLGGPVVGETLDMGVISG